MAENGPVKPANTQSCSLNDPCKLRPYKPNTCKPKTPHHCVPDHCFRESGENGRYYSDKMNKDDGLCICVEGQVKSSPANAPISDIRLDRKGFSSDDAHYNALAEHGKIHKRFDEAESTLGKKGNPVNTATLCQLEDAAAEQIAKVTQCDEQDLKKQLREYHQKKELNEEMLLRADPWGKRLPPPYDRLGRSAAGKDNNALPKSMK